MPFDSRSGHPEQRRGVKPTVCVALAALTVLPASAALAQTGQACDRACLLGIADAYFAALAAHDPKAPMAPNAKFTEQTQGLTLPLYSKNGWSRFVR